MPPPAVDVLASLGTVLMMLGDAPETFPDLGAAMTIVCLPPAPVPTLLTVAMPDDLAAALIIDVGSDFIMVVFPALVCNINY